MTRAEHLQRAKDRAIAYVDVGDFEQAFASFTSDLAKHPELEGALKIQQDLGMRMYIGGFLNTAVEMRKWIEGFR